MAMLFLREDYALLSLRSHFSNILVFGPEKRLSRPNVKQNSGNLALTPKGKKIQHRFAEK
jgi:hypothetical protein